MGFAYQPAVWHDFYVAAAQINAALWGFFFVAISLHPGQIGRQPRLRNQARVNLLGLFFLLVIALVCILPHQDARALGVELTALWLLWTGVYGASQAQTISRLGISRTPRVAWVRTGAGLVMSLMGLCSGTTLLAGAGGGLLWNFGANVVGIALVLSSAWDITFAPELYEPEASKRAPIPRAAGSGAEQQPRPQ